MSRDRRPLSPVLADEPIVGTSLKRRFRVVLVAVALAIVLTNATTYVIAQVTQAASDRRTDQRIATLEADLAQRRADRARMDADRAVQDETRRQADAQLRRDACVAFDRLPRDAEVLDLRRRYGCTGSPRPATLPSPSAPPGQSGSAANRPTPAGSRSRPTGQMPAPTPVPGPQGPPGPPGPSTPPADDGGLICLPIVGCIP